VKGGVRRFWGVFFSLSKCVEVEKRGEKHTKQTLLGSFVVFINTIRLHQIHPILKCIILYLSIFILLINCTHELVDLQNKVMKNEVTHTQQQLCSHMYTCKGK
jgi:hypothetical protein